MVVQLIQNCDWICENRLNHTSLNLQYKGLNTISEILLKFLSTLFLVKKGTNNKNLDITSFTYSRRAWKSLLYCSRLKNVDAMGVCLCHIETIVHNRSFFTKFAFACNEEM